MSTKGNVGNVKAVLAQQQQVLYNKKLKRAHLVSNRLKKVDNAFVPFNERVNPVTGEVHVDMSLSARAKRVSSWLKLHDREFWDTAFGEKVAPSAPGRASAKAASSSGSVPGERSSPLPAQPKSITYWVNSPSESKTEIFLQEAKASTASAKQMSIAEIDFVGKVNPLSKGDQLLSIMLEVDIIGGTTADKGRVSTLPTGVEHDVGKFLGSKTGCANLVSGVNFISFRPSSDDDIKDVSDLLKGEVVCIYRIDEGSKIFIRKWANYRAVVPEARPASVGVHSTLFV
nr:coat protein [Actinidia yellowing virus 3]